jgi:kynurenine formamidase
MNTVSLAALVVSLHGIIDNNTDEKQAKENARKEIEESELAYIATDFRNNELSQVYFFNPEPISISDAIDDAIEDHVRRLTANGIDVTSVAEVMMNLRYFDTVVFWYDLDEPTDGYLVRFLRYTPGEGDEHNTPLLRPR